LDVAGSAVSAAREYRVFTPSQARDLEQALAVERGWLRRFFDGRS